MRSLIGVYIGAATSEFAFAPQDDCSMSGTGGANSITSNRISFCLGLQGGMPMASEISGIQRIWMGASDGQGLCL